MLKRIAQVFCLLVLGVACAGPQKPVSAADEATLPVYVIGQGWHGGIAFRRADIPPGLLPESADFPGVEYLEFGWGHRDYYQARDPGFWLLLDAAIWPSPSVLHVVGVHDSIHQRFVGFEIVRLDIPRSGFAELVAFIHASFHRNDAARAVPLRRGIVVNSFFYPATGSFHLFNNCNTWAAHALESTGYSLGMPLPFTINQLLERVRRLATPQPKEDGLQNQ